MMSTIHHEPKAAVKIRTLLQFLTVYPSVRCSKHYHWSMCGAFKVDDILSVLLLTAVLEGDHGRMNEYVKDHCWFITTAGIIAREVC
jgi:hypothetical protein